MPAPASRRATYQDVVALFDEFLEFERPTMKDGAPDYTAATLARKATRLKTFQTRLAAINPSSWPVEQQVDHALAGAVMNGLDFDLRVLRPWARDPAFYQSVWTGQSDTPAHEGPTHHALVELWTYAFPLSAADQSKLAAQLRGIPPLLAQARANLTGNARDLWITGTGTMQQQVTDLDALAKRVAGGGARAEGSDRVCPHCDHRVRDLARAPGAVEERTVRDRQGALQLEPPQRPPRAADVGRRGRDPQA